MIPQNGNGSFHALARECLAAGMCVVPAGKNKAPALNLWADFQNGLPVADEVDEWFGDAHRHPHGIGFICGLVSGGLEVLDFDAKYDSTGTLNDRALAAIRQFSPGLLERLVIERTPSGGLHLYYRCEKPRKNAKLAWGVHTDGKRMAVVETRGEGGFIVGSPTPGYSLIQGRLAAVPTITEDEHSALLAAARSLDTAPQAAPPPEPVAPKRARTDFPAGFIPPGDAYDQTDDWMNVAKAHGWTTRNNKFWSRPGKTDGGTSATWDTLPDLPRHFYVFSPNAAPLEDGKTYKPWSIFAHLECGGDFIRAAEKLYEMGFGTRKKAKPGPAIESDAQAALDDHNERVMAARGEETPAPDSLSHEDTGLVGRPFGDFVLPPHGDPIILLGDRYLCRGDGLIIASTSGMGKSSLLLQLATGWALGRGFYEGLKPARPLKTLIFQSEDSDGDIAEVRLSLYHAMKLTPEEQAQVNLHVIIVTDRIHRGASFHKEMRRQIAIHHPDIVAINPLLAFIGGDINDAEAAGAFLRDGLNAANEPATHAYVAVHHTAKPPKEKQDRKWNEVMYDMAGSADLTNWARAIISLRPSDVEGEFRLVFAKRGVRAGYTKKVKSPLTGIEYDEPNTVIGLKHSKERIDVAGRNIRLIHWEQCTPPDETAKGKGGRPMGVVFSEFISVFPRSHQVALPFADLYRVAQAKQPVSKTPFFNMVKEQVEIGTVRRDDTNPNRPKFWLLV